jgi:ABC-type transport system involved in multi-copper enzyme maturation permease subunit
VWSLCDKVFEYFERLGIAGAVGAAGLAVIHFKGQILPAAPILPAVIGILLVISTFFLVVFGTAASVLAIFGKFSKLALGLTVGFFIAVSLCFVLALFALAEVTINPPAPAPAQQLKCDGTNGPGKTEPAKAGMKVAAPES